jgi:hypothetical protein
MTSAAPAKLWATKKQTCKRHCFSTLNHNLGSGYNVSRVIKWVWTQVVTNCVKGGARISED